MAEIKIGELKEIEAKELVDLSEFEGMKRKIKTMEVIDVKSHYINGQFSANDTIDTKVLRIMTEPVTKDSVEYVPSELFNIQKDKDGNWGISTSPKSKLRKVMLKFKCNKIEELKDKEVIIRLKQSGFLGFFN